MKSYILWKIDKIYNSNNNRDNKKKKNCEKLKISKKF